MDGFSRLARHSTESEKALESMLVERVRRAGGLCLKYYSATAAGYPDRLCLFPGGRFCLVELKSRGKRPTPLQRSRHEKLRELGFACHVADSPAEIDRIVSFYEPCQ